ncbi:MAG TPA: hypothetical protein VGQ35_09465 [Dongiaceae bacterium]|jgi:hypothetical protein|nr:hypothetical protein [Dongiaceae bacterium]
MVPTRFDIHADSDRKTADSFPDVSKLEINIMNRILMAAAVLMVSATPLAFAAASGSTTGTMSSAYLTTEHCPNLDQQFSTERFKSESARQVAEEKAEALCRQDKHKFGGEQFGSKVKPANLLLMKG